MAALGEARTTHRPGVRRSPAPRGPRRISGPARGKAAAPRSAPRATRSQAVARGGWEPIGIPAFAPRALDALKRLPDSRAVDRILRGQTWVAIIGVALIGIVFMQVTLLKMNAGIGADVDRSTVLERQNADLRASVSQLSSEERIQTEAAKMGLQMPPAGDVRYVRTRGAEDAGKAVRVMRAPAPVDPATLAATATATAGVTETTTTTDPAAATTTTTDPAAATTAEPTTPATTTAPPATTTTTDPATATTTTAPAPVAETQAQPTTGAVAAP